MNGFWKFWYIFWCESLEKFEDNCAAKSEMCQYFLNYLKCMRLIEDFIRADRQADFLIHIKAVKELLPLFCGGDGVHCQRCGSFYYELLNGLPNKHPDLYLKIVCWRFRRTNKQSPLYSSGWRYEVRADNKSFLEKPSRDYRSDQIP